MKMAGTAGACATAVCIGAIATVFGESVAIGVGITTVGITTAGTTIAIELHWGPVGDQAVANRFSAVLDGAARLLVRPRAGWVPWVALIHRPPKTCLAFAHCSAFGCVLASERSSAA
jgi:hypothetical protein